VLTLLSYKAQYKTLGYKPVEEVAMQRQRSPQTSAGATFMVPLLLLDCLDSVSNSNIANSGNLVVIFFLFLSSVL
jgi:hypothetical protein